MPSILLVCLTLLLVPGLAGAQVRMTRVDEVAQQVTIKNFGTSPTPVDISGYFMCLAPGTYQQLSALTIVGSGDLSLSPGEEVTLVYTFIPASGGIGLYISSGFTNPNNLADYVQYDGVAGVREDVAVAAGIWTTGAFASGTSGPFSYWGDGTQNGAFYWTSIAVPAAGGGARIAFVAAVLACVGVLRSQRTRRPGSSPTHEPASR